MVNEYKYVIYIYIYSYMFIIKKYRTIGYIQDKDCIDDMEEIQGTCNASKSQGKTKSAKEDHWVWIQLKE